MENSLPIHSALTECETWHCDYPFVFQSEVAALKCMLPTENGVRGIEVGLGAGKFAESLGIWKGQETAAMKTDHTKKGSSTVSNVAVEKLPYPELQFDFVLMASCISFFNDLHVAFGEAYRVLKKEGVLVIGFIDRNSPIGQQQELFKTGHAFYRQANFFAVEKVVFELNLAGFKEMNFVQTLFNPLPEIQAVEIAKPGYGQGSYVVIQARKK